MKKICFFAKCRPQDADIIEYVRKYKRVFIGYPVYKDTDFNKHHSKSWLYDLSTIKSEEELNKIINNKKSKITYDQNYRSHVTNNYHLIHSIAKDSIVLIPRPGSGICYMGKVEKFELVENPDWADDYIKQRKEQKLECADISLHIADVVQTWKIHGDLKPVPFPIIPQWISGQFHRRQQIGIIHDAYDNLSAYETLGKIWAGTYRRSRTPTNDPDKLKYRMLESISTNSFEQLCCEEDRYQFQPWYVKAYRWLKYTPPAFVYAAWTYLTFPERKLRKNDISRKLMAELIFIKERSGMQHWYTKEEVFNKSKRK